jgi:hypothetical protein
MREGWVRCRRRYLLGVGAVLLAAYGSAGAQAPRPEVSEGASGGGVSWPSEACDIKIATGVGTRVATQPVELRTLFPGPNGSWGAPATGGLFRVDESSGAWVPALQAIETTEAVEVALPAAKPARAKIAWHTRVSQETRTPAASVILWKKSAVTAVVYDMAFGQDAWYAATENGILVSRDRGTSWIQAPAGDSSIGAVRAIDASSTDASAWALSGDALLTSHDGGRTWTVSPLPFGVLGTAKLFGSEDADLS